MAKREVAISGKQIQRLAEIAGPRSAMPEKFRRRPAGWTACGKVRQRTIDKGVQLRTAPDRHLRADQNRAQMVSGRTLGPNRVSGNIELQIVHERHHGRAILRER